MFYAARRTHLVRRSLRRYTTGAAPPEAYSFEVVCSEDNLSRTAAKFSTMKPIRLQSHEPFKKAAVLIPLCVVNRKVSLLYTLRAPHMKTHRGQVSFPGGMQETNDSTLQSTALRETEEELGLSAKRIRVWGVGNFIVTRAEVCVLPVIGQVLDDVDVSALRINRDEVGEVFAVSLEDLCNPQKNGYTQFRNAYSTPIFLGGSRRIWGLTAIITNAFLKALLPNTYTHKVKYIPSVKFGMKHIPA